MNARIRLVRDTLPCIRCGTKLERAIPVEQNHPDSAVACTSHGNYGSTVFDPGDGHYLEINLCDSCLVQAAEEGRVALGYIDPQMGVPLVHWYEGLEDEYPTAAAKSRIDAKIKRTTVDDGFLADLLDLGSKDAAG